MEPLTMFAAAVGLISAIHLLSLATDKVGAMMTTRQKKRTDRTDWYCFFQASDLTDGTKVQDTPQQQNVYSDEELLQQRRRQQANRPRLHA